MVLRAYSWLCSERPFLTGQGSGMLGLAPGSVHLSALITILSLWLQNVYLLSLSPLLLLLLLLLFLLLHLLLLLLFLPAVLRVYYCQGSLLAIWGPYGVPWIECRRSTCKEITLPPLFSLWL